jgi:hypothetical protein
MELTDKMIKRFWMRVLKKGLNECWNWIGGKTKGYGAFRVGSRVYRAHRISYHLAYGECPDDLMIMHACDNPRCVNPSHLTLGTCADNLHDMVVKGRSNRGERNGNAKLTTKKVMKIKMLLTQNVPHKQIASMTNVPLHQVKNISYGHTWKHVTIDAR